MMIPKIVYSHRNTKITNYHDLNKPLIKILAKEIMYERIRKNLPRNRSIKSYYREILAHKRMYKLLLFRRHTIDCDLEEHIRAWKEIIYFIFSI